MDWRIAELSLPARAVFFATTSAVLPAAGMKFLLSLAGSCVG